MSMPPSVPRVLICALMLAVFNEAAVSQQQQQKSQQRHETNAGRQQPNLVWLVSEDNSEHWLDLYDTSGAATPSIAKLAAQGLVFDNAFSNAPVCSVARTTLITGCYAPRIGTQFHRRAVEVPLPEGVQMFPALLRQAGYYTANNSKKDYNAVESSDVWDESSRKASWKNRRENQPFFYMQSFTTSHESSLHFPASDVQTQPTQHDPQQVVLAPCHPDTPLFRYTYARYLDRITQVDQEIGRVVDQLTADGLLDDTFIFYFGDHGGVLPRGKGYAYDNGLHVPLVVRIPARWAHLIDGPVPARTTGFVSFIDFGPTLLHLAGVDIPASIDGTPFLGPGISRDSLSQRDESIGYADRFDEKYDLVRTLRKGRFAYVRSYQPFNVDALQNNYRYQMAAYTQWRQLARDGQLNDVQQQFFQPRPSEALYDVDVDPHQVSNLADNPEYSEILHSLRDRLATQVRAWPDLSFYPESLLASEAFQAPVAFGTAHKEAIQRLANIADLPLKFGDEMKLAIVDSAGATSLRVGDTVDSSAFESLMTLRVSLSSPDTWERYWSLIAASAIGTEYGWHHVEGFRDAAAQMASMDAEPLVRVRAAEFLGLSGFADPYPFLVDAINATTSSVQTGLALNTVTLLQDHTSWGTFPLNSLQIPDRLRTFDAVKRRLQYLSETPAP